MHRYFPGGSAPWFLLSYVRSWVVAAAVVFAWSPVARATVDTYGLGNGHDGPLVATGSYVTIGTSTKLVAAATSGANTISIATTSSFPVGRLVMVVRTSGVVPARVVGDSSLIDLTTNDIGRFELARITGRTTLAGGGVQLTLDQSLSLSWPIVGSQVVEVPEYTTVSIASGTNLAATAYSDGSGGITAFLATSKVTNNGTIGGFGQGFGGAYGTASYSSSGCSENDLGLPFKGEGISSLRRTLRGPGMVGNAGGAGCSTGGGGGGGGVGRGADGLNPTTSTLGRGGVGSSATDALGGPLMRLTFGGGGGAGHTNLSGGVASGMSGDGGGVVFIRAQELAGAGTINVSGRIGNVIYTQGGGGGGGGGTAVVLTTGPLVCTAILANGGTGGVNGTRSGGHGGGGRIVLQGSSISCPTSVTSGAGTGNAGGSGIVQIVSPPSLTLSQPSAIFANESALFWGTATSGSVVTLSVDGVTAGTTTAYAGQWSIAAVLSNGSHTVSVRATSSGGASDPVTSIVSASYRVPETTILSGPAARSRTSTFSFSSNVASVTYRCSINGAAYTACANPLTITGLAEGATHTLAVVAVNGTAVDPTPATQSWVLDTIAPETTLTSTPPAARITTSTVTVAFSSNEPGTFQCRVNVGAWAACTSPATLTIPVANVTATINVRAQDAAGNIDGTPLMLTTFVDTIAPDTTITSAPTGTVSDATVSVAFSATESSTFKCSLNSAPFEPCTSPKVLAPGEGAQTFRVQATDVAGLVDPTPAAVSFVVDRTPPPVPMITAPLVGQRVPSRTVIVAGTAAADATVVLTLDGAVVGNVPGNWSLALTVLEGPHTLTAAARDSAGNQSAATSVSFTVDTVAPTVTLTAVPATSAATTATFAFTADSDVTGIVCELDTVPLGPCTSPYTLSALGVGDHSLRVVATDAAGNVGSATHAWTTQRLPLASSATVAVDEDTPVPVTLAGTGTGALTWQLVAGPTLGTLSGDAPNLVYTPTPNATGADAFSFVVVDTVGSSQPATVVITIVAVDDAPLATDAAVEIGEDASADVTLGALDVDSANLVYAYTLPPHGVLSGEAPDLVYTPQADFNGTDTFTFTVDDGTTISAPATVTITVTATNDAPVVAAATAVTDEDVPVALTFSASDVDSDPLVWTVTTTPTLGTLSGIGPDFVYTPTLNAHGIDVIGLTVSDGSTAVTTSATVTVVANNDAPTAVAQTVTTDEDTATAIELRGIDVDSESLAFTVVTPPTKGTLSGTPPALVYTPAANSSGIDAFTFVAGDGILLSAPTVITIVVTSRNDAPFFIPPTPLPTEVVACSTAAPLVIPLAGFDIDGDELTLAIVSAPDSMVLVDGELHWTPTADDQGQHEVVVAVDDGTVAVDYTLMVDVSLADEGLVTTELSPVSDTHVRRGTPYYAYGAEGLLRVGTTDRRKSLIAFSPAAIASALAGRRVVSAHLELTLGAAVAAFPAGQALVAHPLSKPFAEARATYSCADDSAPTNWANDCTAANLWSLETGPFPWRDTGIPLAVTTGTTGTLSFNVTADIVDIKAGTYAHNGWVLLRTLDTQGGEANFRSREAASPPRLVIVTEPEAVH